MILGTGVYIKPAYKILNYIQSSGTQYIDTGFKCNQNTTIETKYQFADLRNGNNIGTVDSGDLRTNGFGMNLWETAYYFGYGSNGSYYSVSGADTNQHIYRQVKNLCYLDDNLMMTCSATTFTNDYNYPILGWIRNGSLTSGSYAKLWYTKIYDGDTLVRDYIPCKRNSDDAIGLWDKVTKTFYGNAGAGTFLYG